VGCRYCQRGCSLIAASATYSDQGLEREPTNSALKSGLESVKKAMDSSSPFGGGGGDNPMASMFTDPNLMGKLASNPRTSKFMADPAFVQKIRDLQSGKSQADMANMLQDQRMLAVLGVAMGVDMVSRVYGCSASIALHLPLYSKRSNDPKVPATCQRASRRS
jgi:stress-induced-phosphoprotein 1